MAEKRTGKADDKPKEPTRKPVGLHRTDGKLYELGFDGIFSYFICHDFKEGGWRKVIEIPINDDLIFVPLCDDLIKRKVIHLPSAPEPYGKEQELLSLVRRFIHTHVAVSEFYERLATYYVLFSWLYDRFSTLPYLRALGDYGTGKSRFLQTIGAICYRPVFASGATTVSPIFRIIDLHQGTLIIDEGDFKNSDSDAEIIKILCCGYQDGFPVIRSEPRGNTFQPIAYNVYGPKLIATRKRFTDKALESRCLTEEMDFQWRSNIPHILPDTFWNEAREIRNRLLQWRFDKYQQVRLRDDLINESIEPRLNQVMMPLASIIDDPTMLADLREFAERYNKLIVTERGQLLEAEILQSIVDLAKDGNREPSVKRVAEHLNRDRKEKEEITAHKVGRKIGDKLKLRKVNRRGVYHLVWDGPKVKKLCERYGVLTDGVDFGGLEDFGDFYREPPRKSTGEEHGDHPGGDGGDQGGGEDFPEPSHSKSTKSTSLRIDTESPPSPDRCDGCPCYHRPATWKPDQAMCQRASRFLRDMDRCPSNMERQPLEARDFSGALAGEGVGHEDKRLQTRERARKGIERVREQRIRREARQ